MSNKVLREIDILVNNIQQLRAANTPTHGMGVSWTLDSAIDAICKLTKLKAELECKRLESESANS